MDWRQFLDGFKFDQKCVLNDQVRSEGIGNPQVIDLDVDQLLPIDLEPELAEVLGKKRLIGRLKEAWTDPTVQVKYGIHGLASELVQLRRYFCHRTAFAPSSLA